MTVENMSKRIGKNLFALVVPALLLLTACGAPAYQRLVVLGDPHIPGNHLEVKQQALDDINTWPDVKLVVAVGDICSLYGTDEEYAAAKEFFARLNKPMAIIDGNHDFIYATPAGQEGGFMPGSSESKQEKLEKFAKIFGQPGLYFSRQLGEYLLVFLAADNEDYQIGITDSQLGWLRQELAAHPKSPTIIFFHAPLVGTLRNYRPWVNQPGAVAQPSEQLREILAANRQVFLWVSGHTHTSLQEESYASPINLYDGRVTDIHNTDMNKGEIWTNSLYLYPDKVVVRTFSHRQQAWLPKFDRTILPPEP